VDTGVCWHCIEDKYLREIIRDQGKPLECSVCNATRNGFTVDELGEQLEPIIRENYQLGEDRQSLQCECDFATLIWPTCARLIWPILTH
jgi:hypothetical protein